VHKKGQVLGNDIMLPVLPFVSNYYLSVKVTLLVDFLSTYLCLFFLIFPREIEIFIAGWRSHYLLPYYLILFLLTK